MEERFELIREKMYEAFDRVSGKLDTKYTPVHRELRSLSSVEAVEVESTTLEDLKERHKRQEEELKKQQDNEA